MLLLIIYIAFISLGLPDALLGSAWPVMGPQMGAALSQAGIVSAVICVGTILSALATERLHRAFGTGRITLFSVALTAVALFGFSTAGAFWQLVLWAIPYGLGAGAVDAVLNAYVATHYEARHMNWLHCMWGVGAAAGPAVMAWQMASGGGWQGGYRTIAIAQCVLVALLASTLALWKRENAGSGEGATAAVSRAEAVKRPGLVFALIGFFCYCALESGCGLWAASFMVHAKGVRAEEAALFASLFYLGITVGRGVSGVLTLRLDGYQLQHLGEALIALGVAVMVLAPVTWLVGAGLVIVGLGCAPIYPQMIQLTPERFGADAADALMGLQMAAAYTGSVSFPPLMGLVLEGISPALFPMLAALLLVVMTLALNRCDALARTRI